MALMRRQASWTLIFGLSLLALEAAAQTLSANPTPEERKLSTSMDPLAPTSTFQLPMKPPRPKGADLMKQIMIALVTVGGCTAAGATLVVLDARYERENNVEKLKAIRSVEHGFLGVIVLLGVILLAYAGYELLKSAGLL